MNGKEYKGILGVVRPEGQGFVVDVALEDHDGLVVGIVGEVELFDK